MRKVIVTGARSTEQLDSAYKFINRIFYDNYDLLKKKTKNNKDKLKNGIELLVNSNQFAEAFQSRFDIISGKEKGKELKNLTDKFKELKSLVYEYKDRKESEINRLSEEQNQLKNEIDQSKEDYEKIIDNAADQIESFIKKASSENQII